MKTIDFLSEFNDMTCRMAELNKSFIQRMTRIKMVADNIRDIISKQWVITATASHIDISPVEGATVLPNEWDHLVLKLAKALNKEPMKYITEEHLDATFYNIEPTFMGKQIYNSFWISVIVGNTEKCDLVEVKREVIDYEPTGYCKALKERKYLVPHDN